MLFVKSQARGVACECNTTWNTRISEALIANPTAQLTLQTRQDHLFHFHLLGDLDRLHQ